MSAPRDPRLYLDEMLLATRELAAILAEGEQAFLASLRVRLAAERLIEILGEAANQLPDEFRQAYPQVPWRALTATRNRIIHGYHSVDPARIWAAIENEIPQLLTQLQAVLQALDKQA